MPHKRSKRSVREQERTSRGTDLAPGSSTSLEDIPKSIARVLDAAKIRTEYKEKKRKSADGEDDGQTKKRRKSNEGDGKGKTKKISIKPGESLKHFNRRVEDDMRPLVRTAMQSSAAVGRKAKKDEGKDSSSNDKDRKLKGKVDADGSDTAVAPPVDQHSGRPKEFSKISTSAPRRLNDIAMAPPDLKKPPRSTARTKQAGEIFGKTSSVLSMAQKAMMEVEREKAIQRYREMKGKTRAAGAHSLVGDGSDEGS